eukprot:gene3563-2514_t
MVWNAIFELDCFALNFSFMGYFYFDFCVFSCTLNSNSGSVEFESICEFVILDLVHGICSVISVSRFLVCNAELIGVVNLLRICLGMRWYGYILVFFEVLVHCCDDRFMLFGWDDLCVIFISGDRSRVLPWFFDVLQVDGMTLVVGWCTPFHNYVEDLSTAFTV